jgi:sulfite exporter TauE/SafE
MIELPLVFIGGLLGSAHCIGMCGPLALALGGTTGQGGTRLGATHNLKRQLAFSGGRIFTYGFGGAVAGYGGYWLSHHGGPTVVEAQMVQVQAWLAMAAGVVLVVMGLMTAGVFPHWVVSRMAHVPCLSGKWVKTFLMAPGLGNALLAGVFTGFIPCGLVYGFLALAASAAGPLRGWLTMVCFGLGTVPLMVLAGCGGSLLNLTTRARVFQIAAWCVVLTGILSFARGVGYLNVAGDVAAGNCPLCQ